MDKAYIPARYPNAHPAGSPRNLYTQNEARRLIAHAQGAEYNGKKADSFCHASAFSFYATKVLFTGEGGIITTNSDEIDRLARILRNQGKHPNDPDLIIEFGNNARMTKCSCRIARIKKAE